MLKKARQHSWPRSCGSFQGSAVLTLIAAFTTTSLLFCQASATVCPPAGPVVDSSFQGQGPSFTDADITITWSRVPLNNTCADQEIYNVVSAAQISSSLSKPNTSYVLCSATNASSCTITIQTLTELNAQSITTVSVQFYVVLYYSTSSPSNYTYDSTSTNGFTSCISLNPTQTNLTDPINGTTVYIGESLYNTTSVEVKFNWTALNVITGFGRYCGSGPVYIFLLTISQDHDSLLVANANNATFDYSQKISKADTTNVIPITVGQKSQPGLRATGTYYWRVFSLNNVDSVGSDIFEFDFEMAPDPCTPMCQYGTCNVTYPLTNGSCICTSGFSGAACSIPPATGSQPPAGNNTVALAAGLGTAGGVILITIIIVVLYVIRERRRAKKELEMSLIVIQAPEYAELAWSPYNLIPEGKLESSKKAAWTKFEQLVLSQDFYVVQSFITSAKTGQLDTMIAWLICLFCRHQVANQLIESLMLREIEAFELNQASRDATTDASGLIPFREDSAATKAFKIFARVTGLPYLFDTLGQIINDFCALLDEEAKKEQENVTSDASSTHTNDSSAAFNAQNTQSPRRSTFTAASMEVDPSRMGAMDDETINRLSLQLICQKLFVKIYRSTSSFPIELRLICSKIKDKAASQPSLKSTNVNLILANLVFLRFINPAVLMPHHYGLVKDDPSSSTKRQLVLITKVLQNLAGGVEFGKKEQYMTKLNPFIQQNTEKMQTFLTELASATNTDETSASATYTAPISDDQFNAALTSLYRHLTQNFEAFTAALGQEASPTRAEAIRSGLVQCMSDIGTI